MLFRDYHTAFERHICRLAVVGLIWSMMSCYFALSSELLSKVEIVHNNPGKIELISSPHASTFVQIPIEINGVQQFFPVYLHCKANEDNLLKFCNSNQLSSHICDAVQKYVKASLLQFQHDNWSDEDIQSCNLPLLPGNGMMFEVFKAQYDASLSRKAKLNHVVDHSELAALNNPASSIILDWSTPHTYENNAVFALAYGPKTLTVESIKNFCGTLRATGKCLGSSSTATAVLTMFHMLKGLAETSSSQCL